MLRAMRYPFAGQPVPYDQAFTASGEVYSQTQAAVLLLLGALSGDTPLRAMLADPAQRDELLPPEDRRALGIPEELFDLASDKARLSQPASSRKDYPRAWRLLGRERVGSAVEVGREVYDRFLRDPNPDAAAALAVASLAHEEPLVRTAAAAAVAQLADGERATNAARPVLETEAQEDEGIVRSLARAILQKYIPASPVLKRLKRPRRSRGGGEPTHTALVVHGTFARTNSWWQPGGDFHTYLNDDVRPTHDVYGAADRYDWSGAYSDSARTLAANQLVAWVNDPAHNLQGLDLFCHSHGANVAMKATHGGLTTGSLVMLSCPVHPKKYMADFTKVQKAVSVHVHWDYVIFVDGGGQKFKHPQIQEHVIGVWFNHSATHEPDVWRNENIASFL